MTIRNLDQLLAPKSVALIGASREEGSVGLITARNLLRGGFAGPVWLVNPKYRDIEGYPCHPSIAALPGTPQLAVIATPPQTVPGIIGELGRSGTRAAVVITAGIRDDPQRAMLEAARPWCLRIQGPNCLGLMVPGRSLNAGFSHEPPLAGDLAFLSQSGALITAIIDWARGHRIGFSHVVSLGDMADADFGDLLDYLAADARSRAILIYMEAVTHARKFLSAARRAARAKPVIVVKAGREAAGARAAMSHTGALAGADAAYEAAFRRAGVLRVRELQDLFSAAEILARHPRLAGERLAILTNGGGAGVLAADRLVELDGRLATLSSPAMAALDSALPPTWSHGNPIDIVGDAGPARYASALDVVLEDPAADAVLVVNCPMALASSTAVAENVVATLESRSEACRPPKPVLTSWLGDEASRGARTLFAARGIPSFATPAEAIDGFMQLVRYAPCAGRALRTPPSMPEHLRLKTEAAGAMIADAVAAGRSTLSEVEAKVLLTCYGIPVVPTDVASSPAEVATHAARWIGAQGACVVTILSDDITRKSDVGGVRLGLERAEEALHAAEDMLERVARQRPEARVKAFSAADGPAAQGHRADRRHVGRCDLRTALIFGAGGTAVEAVGDTAHALPPLDLNLAHDLMRQTRVWRLLQGYRDRPAADVAAIAEALVRLAYLVARHPEVREIDINPLLADETGIVALDARVQVEDPAGHPRVPMAIRPYPSEWATGAQLEPVGAVRIRPIRPADEALYAAFLARLTPEDQRLRFFIARPDLSHRFIACMTQIDYAREMAFVAVAEATGELLGVVRFVADPDYLRGEYAILVRSDLKGFGLGWRLMQHLVAYARAEKLEQLYGTVLAENTTMLRMCRELGFSVEPEPGDAAVRHVCLRLS
jgi:acetyltransferase